MQKGKNKKTMCFQKRNLQNTCAGYNLWVENRFETIAFKHTRDYFDSLDGELYQVGYCRNEKGQEIDIVVQENATDLQYIEAKHRNTSVIKDTDGIVVFGMKDTPGYVITKQPEDFGLTERLQTSLYRIPAPAFFYLIGRMS